MIEQPQCLWITRTLILGTCHLLVTLPGHSWRSSTQLLPLLEEDVFTETPAGHCGQRLDRQEFLCDWGATGGGALDWRSGTRQISFPQEQSSPSTIKWVLITVGLLACISIRQDIRCTAWHFNTIISPVLISCQGYRRKWTDAANVAGGQWQ